MPEASVRYTCAGIHLNMASLMCLSLTDLHLRGDGRVVVEVWGPG
jgi:hypothetical protein